MSVKPRSTVIVIGAGMNGLLSAYYLKQQGFSVEIYERTGNVGGKIQTPDTIYGFREMAANAMLADAEVEAVAEKIGVELVGKSSEASRRYIFRQGKLRQWPLGLISSLRVVFFILAQWLRLGFVKPRSNETLEVWAHRNLGVEATAYLLNPACLGIFAKDSKYLSATLIYNYFFGSRSRSQAKKRSKLRGSVAPRLGMGDFPKKLREYLQSEGVTFHLENTLSEKPKGPVVLATDCWSAQKQLEIFNDSRSSHLAKIPGVGLNSVNVFFATTPVHLKPGFGVLFPREENIAPLGVLFNSFIFPKKLTAGAKHSETWIFKGEDEGLGRGEVQRDVSGIDEIRKVRSSVLHDTSEELEFFVNSWPSALPLYGLELESVLKKLPIFADGVYLMGNYLGEIGLNRFFHRAKAMAKYFSDTEL
jgi:protoporphyrinogen/coproporphyrinogen III oxidase